MGKVLIATLGFDERHVIRSLLRIGYRDISKIYLLIPSWDIDSRTRRAIDEITKISVVAGLSREDVVITKINILDIYDSVRDIIKLLHELLNSHDHIYLSLGGGLRILILETFLSIMLLDRSLRKRIDILIDVESRDKYIVLNTAIPIHYIPSEVEQAVLKELIGNPLSFGELLDRLGVPRTTLWKALNKLQKQDLIIQKDAKYHITMSGKIILAKAT